MTVRVWVHLVSLSCMPSRLKWLARTLDDNEIRVWIDRINATKPYSKVTASPVPEKDIAGSGEPARDEPAAASWLRL